MTEAASSYPLLNVTWTIFIFFAWVIWFWLLIQVFGDVFRRHELSGWGKAGWCVFVVVLPYFGVLTYLITQSSGMNERRQAGAASRAARYDGGVAASRTNASTADQIAQAKQLLDDGAINRAEFDALKEKALAA